MSLLLGLEFDTQYDPRVRDELEQLTGAIQTGVNKIGQFVQVTTGDVTFTGSGSMLWTVEPSDIQGAAGAIEYALVGRLMVLSIAISTSTVSGTLSNQLFLSLPGGYRAVRGVVAPCLVYDNGGSALLGRMVVTAGGNSIQIIRFDSANFSASTNNTYVFGQIMLEVNV